MLTINLRRKQCRRCKKDRPATEFYKNPRLKDGLQSYCKACCLSVNDEWRIANRQSSNASRLKYSHDLKDRVFAKYGPKCAQCGFSDVRALHLDHVNNDGFLDRKQVDALGVRRGSRVSILQKALKDTAGRFQILCANCNVTKAWEFEKSRRALGLCRVRRRRELRG